MQLKEKYPKYNNFIENYFCKTKLKHFLSNEYNYSLIPEDCRSISYLENYNKIMKESLGKSRYIHWINFIHFLKSESTRIKMKIYNNCNANILYKSKFSKFGIKKYEDYEDKNLIENIEKTNHETINDKWLTNKNNSCRYDNFITIYGFCLKCILDKENIVKKENINMLENTFEDLLNNPDSNSKFNLWKFFAEKNIDPENYLLNLNKNSSNNNSNKLGLGEVGYISQLFRIYKNNENFCIYENIQYNCNYCGYNEIKNNKTINHFFQIDDGELVYSGI